MADIEDRMEPVPPDENLDSDVEAELDEEVDVVVDDHAKALALSRQVAAAEKKQARRERTRLLFKSPAFLVGLVIVLFWVFNALFPDLLGRFDPKQIIAVDEIERTPAEGEVIFASNRLSPDGQFWFGTDFIGQDVWSRVVAGARPILVDSAVATLAAVAFGTLLGLVMGYLRGWVDEVLSRIVEAFLSLPVILIALLATASFGESRSILITIIALLFTPIVARTVRASVIAEADLDYVTSARLRGESSLFIMSREIFPNVTGTVIVELTVRFAYAIFTIATLNFFGIGGDPAEPGWGNDIAQNFADLRNDVWWSTLFPAAAIASLVVGVNLIADTIDKVNKT